MATIFPYCPIENTYILTFLILGSMNSKIKFIAVAPLIATIALLSTAIQYAHAVDVPSTATILGVCGLTTVPTAINYGILAPDAESSDQTLQISNTGNVQATVLVKGTAWSTATIPNAMLVGATHYTLTSGQAYGSKTALTGTDTQLTTLTALQQKNTFWQLKATLNDPNAVGPATQTVTLTGQC
jgi:hypothetical protein